MFSHKGHARRGQEGGIIVTEQKGLTILQVNDVHGYLEEHWETFYKGDEVKFRKTGGYARIAEYVNRVRQETEGNALLLDGGDTFHGTYPVVKTKGKILLPILNQLGIDGMTGHWDFAYGPRHLQEIAAALNYPMLAINCYKKETKKLAFQPYHIKRMNGLKIGIIGIAATIVDKTMPAQFSEGISLTTGQKELPKYIKEVKEEHAVDLVVVLSHLGYPQDIEMAEATDGIDVYLSAHTHNRIYEPAEVNGAIVIQSGCHGSFIGRLDLTVKDKKITAYSHELVTMDETISEEPEMKELIEEKVKPYREEVSQVIGETATDLYRNEVLESTMDNFLLQSLLEHTGAEVAFSNGWRYGAPVPKGPLTLNDLWNIIPVNPPVSTVKLTGQEIWDMLEENLEATFSREPFKQMGGYAKRMLGLKLYAKLENPKGHRLQELFIKGEPVDKERVYPATFVTVQGVPAKYGKDRKQLNTGAIEVLQNYVEKHKTVEAPHRGTITLI